MRQAENVETVNHNAMNEQISGTQAKIHYPPVLKFSFCKDFLLKNFV